ncbi:hypothetical protein [Pedobacter endophyticus]|uniref:Uncharacterized protein n=1 Tax=Pedobacter endophyticus TaxID=2789740 RepID=A0A7U3SQ38_9SPHI|nr:hypothetical protein [Pedobacter endophyticus]QPH38539.1 hypothetical protein IZT61_15805 [Pedobacter endophyticus]
MKNNGYEYLLNSIYYRGGITNQGMNDLLYQEMQNEYGNLNHQQAGANLNGGYAFKKSFLVVRNYVQQAIKHGMKNLRLKMEVADITKLTYIVAMLNREFFDKKSLDSIIASANAVFSQYNLKN